MNITLHGNIAELIDEQKRVGNYESYEDLVYEALQALISQKIEQGIHEGLCDVNKERHIEISKTNLQSTLSKPIEQWSK